MIDVIFKHKGKDIKTKIPENWEEITVRQFLALENLEKPIEILSELMDTDLSFIENTRTDLAPALSKILQIFNKKPPIFKNPHHKGFILQGKRIHFPRDIDKMMFGQVIQINQLIDEDINKNLSKIAGISIQPLFDGKYIEENQAKYTKLIEMSLAVDVFSELFFFAETLKKHLIYGSQNSPIYN